MLSVDMEPSCFEILLQMGAPPFGMVFEADRVDRILSIGCARFDLERLIAEEVVC